MKKLFFFLTILSFSLVGYSQVDTISEAQAVTHKNVRDKLNESILFMNTISTSNAGIQKYAGMFFKDSAAVIVATGGGVWDPITNATNTLFRFSVPSLSDKLLHILYTAVGGNSCVYTSGNYAVNCTESCNVTNTDYDIGGNNISIIGNGTITYTNSTISNWLNLLIQGLDSTNRCTVITKTGGGFQNG